MDGFQEGYGYFEKNAPSYLTATMGAGYIESVNLEIDKLIEDLNQFEGFRTASDKLKGDIAEFWHAGTFNIKAVLNDSEDRAIVDRSHDFASPDISTTFGEFYGLKFYKSGDLSAKAQATSVFQRFKEYQSQGGQDTFDAFLSKRNFSDESVLNDPIYAGQTRIIPRDQLEEATEWLQKMIAKESVRRPDQVYRYQETLEMLRDRLDNGKGIESISLSKEEAQELASLAKQGKVLAADLGLTTEELVQYEHVLRRAIKSGMSAISISVALKVAPEVIKAIDYLIRTGEIDEGQFKAVGFAAVSGTAEGFIRGSVSAALTTVCTAGMMGEALKTVSPAVVGAVTVLAMNTIENSFQVVIGRKTPKQLGEELTRDIYISAWSLLGGGIAQSVIEIPMLGYMIGSFVGSVFGSLAYKVGQEAVLSFCVDTGFTMFGLVDQDYTLPKEIMAEIGIETIEQDTFAPDSFRVDSFRVDTFIPEAFEPDRISIRYLRRGVIGVSKIGYV